MKLSYMSIRFFIFIKEMKKGAFYGTGGRSKEEEQTFGNDYP